MEAWTDKDSLEDFFNENTFDILLYGDGEDLRYPVKVNITLPEPPKESK